MAHQDGLFFHPPIEEAKSINIDHFRHKAFIGYPEEPGLSLNTSPLSCVPSARRDLAIKNTLISTWKRGKEHVTQTASHGEEYPRRADICCDERSSQ